jgi:nucleoside-diphosphate-sugar epimerase
MSVLLTGATGFIGRGVLNALIAADYRVTALVEDQDEAAEVQAAGAEAFFASDDDTRTIGQLALESDGVIHTATSRAGDPEFLEAIKPGLTAGDKPFIYTSSLWTFGSGTDLSETSPQDPPAAVAWMVDVQKALLAEESVRSVIVFPGIVYGHGQGIPRRFVDDAEGTGGSTIVPVFGDGSQHWATVHVDDLADLYVRIIGAESHNNELYIATSGDMPTVADLAGAAASAVGGTTRPETPEQTAQRINQALAELLLLDQHAASDRARERLGWRTTGPSLVDELRAGYLNVPQDQVWE